MQSKIQKIILLSFFLIFIINFIPIMSSQCIVKVEIFNKGKEKPNGFNYLDLKVLEIIKKDFCPVKINKIYRTNSNFSDFFKAGYTIRIEVKETETEKNFVPQLVWKNINYKNETKNISLIGSSDPISELESNALNKDKYNPFNEEKKKIKYYIYIITLVILSLAIFYLVKFILKSNTDKREKFQKKIPYNYFEIEKQNKKK